MRSALLALGFSAFLVVAMTSAVVAAPATPVGKVLKKAQEEARRHEAGEPPPKPEEKPAAKRPVKVTISKETTYITSPLRPDGYPDYVAALDAIAARGVTPENNAVVLLVQAFGPKAIREEHRVRYFEKLGIRSLPETDEYMEPFLDFIDRQRQRDKKPAAGAEDNEEQSDAFDKQYDELDHAVRQPWSEKDCPFVAAWLQANSRPLRLIVEATRRARYYSPLFGSGYMEAPLPDIGRAREAARALTAHALLRLHQGNVKNACSDLLHCHRLARLVGQGPADIDMLLGSVLDGVACCGDRAAAHFGNLTPGQIRHYRTELERLGPMPRIADKLESAERFLFLDFVCSAARDGWPTIYPLLQRNVSLPEDPFWGALLHWAVAGPADWNQILRTANSYYDRLAAAARKPSYRERKAAFAQIESEIKRIEKEVREKKPFLTKHLRMDPSYVAAPGQCGAMLFGWMLPAYDAVANLEYRTATVTQLTDIALALALYRAERGGYPERLEQLAPKYVAEMPKDLYSGAAIRYKREGTGYLLYSLGPNGKDDGGRGRFMDPPPAEDEEVEEDADDIGFRMLAIKR